MCFNLKDEFCVELFLLGDGTVFLLESLLYFSFIDGLFLDFCHIHYYSDLCDRDETCTNVFVVFVRASFWIFVKFLLFEKKITVTSSEHEIV